MAAFKNTLTDLSTTQKGAAVAVIVVVGLLGAAGYFFYFRKPF